MNPIIVSLEWLESAQEFTETLATPHRLFDAKSVRTSLGEQVKVLLDPVYVEYANTGIRLPLDRYHCTAINESKKQEVFSVDLIQGLLELSLNNLQAS